MTPGARISAMIEILETVLAGVPTEKALTNWARARRFAGSKDRAAIRDYVYQAVRCRRSSGAWPSPGSARAWALGSLRQQGADIGALFNGLGHAPAILDLAESDISSPTPPDLYDVPDWVLERMIEDHGMDKAHQIARILRDRAPVCLRVNLRKATVQQVQEALEADGILTELNPICDTALNVLSNHRKVAMHACFKNGLIEKQDAGSQAVAARIPVHGRILDYCAGGGGKSLAIAARTGATLFAHDINHGRMSEIEPRANRGGHDISVIAPDDINTAGVFDTLICDIPCSGSGAWRRSPDGKWRLTSDELLVFVNLQRKILEKAIEHLAPGGTLAMVTCSIFASENQEQKEWLLSTFKDLTYFDEMLLTPADTHDGLYLVTFKNRL